MDGKQRGSGKGEESFQLLLEESGWEMAVSKSTLWTAADYSDPPTSLQDSFTALEDGGTSG